MSLSTEIVTVLLPLLTKAGEAIAGKLGNAAWESAEKIYSALKSRFDEHPNNYYADSFRQFEEAPEDWQETFQVVLAKFLKEDEGFAQTLQELLKDSGHKSTGPTFITDVSGNARVGQIVNAETIEGLITSHQQVQSPQYQAEPMLVDKLSDNFNLLRRNLAERFNIEELASIAYDLGIDPESLPAQTKGQMILGLVDTCRRKGCIPQIVQICGQLRPHVTRWHDQNI